MFSKLEVSKLSKGNRIEDLYYMLLNFLSEGRFSEADKMIKINEWWWEKLPSGCREQVREQIVKGLRNRR